jgi:hypothetical protein
MANRQAFARDRNILTLECNELAPALALYLGFASAPNCAAALQGDVVRMGVDHFGQRRLTVVGNFDVVVGFEPFPILYCLRPISGG